MHIPPLKGYKFDKASTSEENPNGNVRKIDKKNAGKPEINDAH